MARLRVCARAYIVWFGELAGVELGFDHLVELCGVELIAGPALQRVIQVHDDHVVSATFLQNSLGIIDYLSCRFKGLR